MANPPHLSAHTNRVVLDHIELLGYRVHVGSDADNLVLVATDRQTGEQHMVQSRIAEYPTAVAQLAEMIGIDLMDG